MARDIVGEMLQLVDRKLPIWIEDWKLHPNSVPLETYIARRSAIWASDHELDACCEWVSGTEPDCQLWGKELSDELLSARRPELA